MADMDGRNINKKGTARVTVAIALNANNDVVIAPANPDRRFFRANMGANPLKTVWIKLEPSGAGVKKGITIGKQSLGQSAWEMPVDNIYTGEICAIAETDSPNVYVTEY